MTVDISTDYTEWDNVETLYCTYSIDGDQQPRVTISYGLRVNPRLKISGFSGVRTGAKHVVFWLPVAEFGSDEPDGNMTIQDSSDVKYALDGTTDPLLVSLGTSQSHWSVLCVRFQDEP